MAREQWPGNNGTVTETRILTFAGARGDLLTARLDLPDRKPNAVVLVAHCFGGGNAGLAAAQMARGFAERDMAVLSLDFGAADGEADGHVVSLGADDLAIAVGQLRSAVAAPDILLGHSRAGAAILAVAGEVPEARAVVTVGTPADGVRLASPGQLSGPELHQRIASLRRALLIMHAPGDQVVDIDQARIIFEAARHPKSFMSLDGADHQLTRPADAAYAASIIAAWAARYLPASESAASESTASESAAEPRRRRRAALTKWS